MKNYIISAAFLALAACAAPQTLRQMGEAEARQHCERVKHSPLVMAGLDPTFITLASRHWTRDGARRIGDYSARSTNVQSIDHPEPLYHELIHRGLDMVGERFWSPAGFGSGDTLEHSLIYYVLDRDFPGLQEGRIHATKRRWARERWEQPEWRAKLAAIEAKARAVATWCGRK